MPTYDCKTKDCLGKISFPDTSTRGNKSEDDRVIKMIVIGERPVSCKECGKSWYQSELS